MSIQSNDKSKKSSSTPFQMRLDNQLRLAMEKAQKEDGDESLAGWMKRILRKELASRGLLDK